MNKESKLLTPLEAFQLFCRELKIENSDFANAIEGELKDCVISRAKIRELENNIEYLLKDFEELKKGIAWRKAEYKKELDNNCDFDGVPLDGTNRFIVMNLYNIMCALESYYKEKN